MLGAEGLPEPECLSVVQVIEQDQNRPDTSSLIYLAHSLVLCRQCSSCSLRYKRSTYRDPQPLKAPMNKSIRIGLIGKR